MDSKDFSAARFYFYPESGQGVVAYGAQEAHEAQRLFLEPTESMGPCASIVIIPLSGNPEDLVSSCELESSWHKGHGDLKKSVW